MGTEFSALNTALSALYAQRTALEVTGQNVANASTPGYTRQRVILQAVSGSVRPALYATSDGIGSGVTVSGVQRMQDAFLQAQADHAHGASGMLDGNAQALTQVERAFGEPGDTGLQSMMANFWNSWDDLASSPKDGAARSQLLGAAQAVTGGFNHAAASMDAQWTSNRENLATSVNDVNITAANVASLNKAIIAATGAGNTPNDLMDQRDALVKHLADTVGATVKNNSDGSVDVYVGGGQLVSGASSDTLAVTGATALAQENQTPPQVVGLTWSNGSPATVPGGSVASSLNTLNVVLPGYTAKLNAVAQQLVTTVNTAHESGWDLNGDQGGAFFDPAGVTAATISVAITDPSKIAASGQQPTLDGGGNPIPNLDGSNASKLAAMAGTGADESYRQLIVSLGADSAAATQRSNTQTSVTTSADAALSSQTGVSLDEEMTNMVAHQQAYNAAARYLTTINQTIGTLINMVGA